MDGPNFRDCQTSANDPSQLCRRHAQWRQCNAKNRACYKPRGTYLLSEVIGLLNIGEAVVGVTC